MSCAFDIVPVETAGQLDEVRRLFQEYWESFKFSHCFQNFGAELAGLPGDYAPPAGRLALALPSRDREGAVPLPAMPSRDRKEAVPLPAAGCIALRPFDAERCEAKRLYVRPAHRGLGIGRALLDWVIAEARAAGYRELLGDTMPVMERALAMYDRMGFERTAPHEAKPTEGAIYIRLCLR